MKSRVPDVFIIPLLLAWSSQCQGKMIRNNALMHQMMNHFQRGNYQSGNPVALTHTSSGKPEIHITYYEKNPGKVITLMQNVLCRNFPDIPCHIIMQDPALNKLITRSIIQIFNNQMSIQNGIASESHSVERDKTDGNKTQIEQPTTPVSERIPPRINQPRINSEDLSNFLAVDNTGYFQPKTLSVKSKKNRKNRRPKGPQKNYWSKEKRLKKNKNHAKEPIRTDVYNAGQKKMRKFYPHKKYKDKKNTPSKLREYSDEKVSISIEVPEATLPQKKDPNTFKVESSGQPVWRLDYMKHGVPSFNKYGYGDQRLMGKLRNNANVLGDDELQPSRKEVMHTDLFIKNNFHKKNSINMHSEGLELK